MKAAGEREDVFHQLLLEFGAKFGDPSHTRPSIEELKTYHLMDGALSTYRALGGRGSELPNRPGRYDFVLRDLLIELDEEAHFNRYRASTLKTLFYEQLSGFDAEEYSRLCFQHEPECLARRSGGGFWTNSSCERYFGPAAPNRDLSGNGAPRWKQRAFYDYMKDLTPLIDGPPVLRFSIFDRVPDGSGRILTLNDILVNRDAPSFGHIWQLINSV